MAKHTQDPARAAASAVCKCGCGLRFTRTTLRVADVQSNGALQMRVRLNTDAIKEHADHYRRAAAGKLEEGETNYDLIEVVHLPDGTTAVVNGNHRRGGMKDADTREHDFLVAEGTLRQAAHHAARANVGNITVAYTLADKQNACKRLYAIYGNISGRTIAEMAGVSPTTAEKHRPLEQADKPRKGKDGKVRKAPVIKSKPKASTVQGGQFEGDARKPPAVAPAVTNEGRDVAGKPPAAPPPATSAEPVPASTVPTVDVAANAAPPKPTAAEATVGAVAGIGVPPTVPVAAGKDEREPADEGSGEPGVTGRTANETAAGRADGGALVARTYRFPATAPWFTWLVDGACVLGIVAVEQDESTCVEVAPPVAASKTVEPQPESVTRDAVAAVTPKTGPGARGENVPSAEVALLRKRAVAYLKAMKQPHQALVRAGVFGSNQAAGQFLAGRKGLSVPRATALEAFLDHEGAT